MEGALARTHRPQDNGAPRRIVRITGDGLLVEFASALAAVRCAVEIQRDMAERNTRVPQEQRIEFRMGINVGDIIIDGTDMWGEGVNVAARLEALSEPGGICVSRRVHEDVCGRMDVAFEDTGERQLKNIARPVRVYCVRLKGPQNASRISAIQQAINRRPALQQHERRPPNRILRGGRCGRNHNGPIAMRWLFVIARNSSFTYKGRAVDVKQVGRELGVRYVLEGGVRKAANRVRITAQLIDASTGAHLWADRFEGALEDIFDLQDQVTASVVGAIAPKLEQAERSRKHKPTQSLDAYDYFLRGIASLHRGTEEANNEALRLFHKAIELTRISRRLMAWPRGALFGALAPPTLLVSPTTCRRPAFRNSWAWRTRERLRPAIAGAEEFPGRRPVLATSRSSACRRASQLHWSCGRTRPARRHPNAGQARRRDDRRRARRSAGHGRCGQDVAGRRVRAPLQGSVCGRVLVSSRNARGPLE